MIEEMACDIVHHAARRGVSGTLMGGITPAYRLVGIGFYVCFCIIGMTLGGRELDNVLDTGAVLTLVGLGLGLAMAIWGAIRQLFEVLAEIRARQTGRTKE